MGFKFLREKMQCGELSDNRRHALNVIIKACCDNKVRLQTPLEKYVYYDSPIGSNGFFIDEPTPILAVALDQPQEQWYTIICHEYSHMCQWLDDDPLYWNFDDDGNLDDWLCKKVEYNENQLNKIVQNYILLELDAEERTVAFMEKMNVDINIQEYIQKANSYILFYHIVKRDRNFYTNRKEPYALKNVWKKMPISFDDVDYLEPLSYEIESMFDECRR